MAFNSFLEAGFLEGVVAFNATVFILHIWIDFRQQRVSGEAGQLLPSCRALLNGCTPPNRQFKLP